MIRGGERDEVDGVQCCMRETNAEDWPRIRTMPS